VPLTDVPEKPGELKRIRLKLKPYVDDANPLVRDVWEPKLTKRLNDATAMIMAATGVTFDIAPAAIWKSDTDLDSLEKCQIDFEEKVKAEKGVLHLGFTSRLARLPVEGATMTLGRTLGPFRSHLILRDGYPRTEAEQTELLIHEIGHYLGAVVSPDNDSVMRAKLGDGRANLKSFAIRFDPLNLLAMGIWAEEYQPDRSALPGDLKSATQQRLARIYETIAKTMPGERYAETITALLQVNPVSDTAVAGTPAKPAATASTGTVAASPAASREQAVRKVVKGITIRLGDLAKRPADKRPTGDALTVELVRFAADVASQDDPKFQSAAFAIGLGIALDDSTILRSNPLTKSFCSNVESDAEFKERCAILGSPTMHNRRDLCQHFVVSCALTELIGPALAKQAGIAKEFSDMKGSSGFSFCDLAMDFAGVELIERVRKDRHLLSRIRQSYRVGDFAPSVDGLAENLNAAAFERQFGSAADPRYKSMLETIDARIQKLGGYAP
jgi:hypothetical protein